MAEGGKSGAGSGKSRSSLSPEARVLLISIRRGILLIARALDRFLKEEVA